jgi:ribosome-associated protein
MKPKAGIETDGIRVNDSLVIPRSELVMRASRSSGAGGQHVNKTSSRIEISWNVRSSQSASDQQRERILERLSSRLSDDGSLRVVASDTRSQLRNREAAENRLAETIRKALMVPKKRKPTRKPRAADEARLAEKKRQSERKRERKRPITD